MSSRAYETVRKMIDNKNKLFVVIDSKNNSKPVDIVTERDMIYR